MQKRRVTMEDLARQCRVSVATVSRVLAGQPGVRPELRRRVREAAAALGYALPVAMAGRLAVLLASRSALIDATRSQFTLHVLKGMRERAAALGMTLEIRPIDAHFAANFGAGEAAAGYLLLSPESDAQIDAAAAGERPVILVNADDPLMRLSSVAPCNRSAAALATERLIALGHRRILLLTRPGRRTIAQRREGWAERLAAQGLKADLVEEVGDWDPELAAAAIRARLDRNGLDFTAILATGDSLAIGAMLALSDRGVAVPGEVSVMGFDGLPQGELQSPPLSTIEIPMRSIGAAAIDLLRDVVVNPQAPPRRVEIGCRILERGSTGPAAPRGAAGISDAGASDAGASEAGASEAGTSGGIHP